MKYLLRNPFWIFFWFPCHLSDHVMQSYHLKRAILKFWFCANVVKSSNIFFVRVWISCYVQLFVFKVLTIWIQIFNCMILLFLIKCMFWIIILLILISRIILTLIVETESVLLIWIEIISILLLIIAGSHIEPVRLIQKVIWVWIHSITLSLVTAIEVHLFI